MDIKKLINKAQLKRPLPYRIGRFFCILIFIQPAFSQVHLGSDVRKSFKQKPAFYGSWDGRYTFIDNRSAEISSVKAGLDFAGRLKLGIAYNWFKGEVPLTVTTDEGTHDYRLKLRYGTFFLEYTYFMNQKWEAGIPIQFGAGWASFDRIDTEEKENVAGRMVFFYEPMSVVQYRFWRFFAAGGGIGLRLAVTRDDRWRLNYNSPVFVIRTKIYFVEMFKALFGKEPKDFLPKKKVRK